MCIRDSMGTNQLRSRITQLPAFREKKQWSQSVTKNSMKNRRLSSFANFHGLAVNIPNPLIIQRNMERVISLNSPTALTMRSPGLKEETTRAEQHQGEKRSRSLKKMRTSKKFPEVRIKVSWSPEKQGPVDKLELLRSPSVKIMPQIRLTNLRSCEELGDSKSKANGRESEPIKDVKFNNNNTLFYMADSPSKELNFRKTVVMRRHQKTSTQPLLACQPVPQLPYSMYGDRDESPPNKRFGNTLHQRQGSLVSHTKNAASFIIRKTQVVGSVSPKREGISRAGGEIKRGEGQVEGRASPDFKNRLRFVFQNLAWQIFFPFRSEKRIFFFLRITPYNSNI
eukprot:TRINITY_DN23915_c0_g2_i1.p1 TRINITY_DN23915_c0_g2~~TRINITY_DN23915_c0_g2_i1.p1  ORF type:complete len:359 (-),score=17.17 TRINITY_DN23915_c0_g2_i1:154-1170(-)